tara:strand:- start:27 stop:206 length:180 start_codon:yes stop_codon:yes gene_type:complete
MNLIQNIYMYTNEIRWAFLPRQAVRDCPFPLCLLVRLLAGFRKESQWNSNRSCHGNRDL